MKRPKSRTWKPTVTDAMRDTLLQSAALYIVQEQDYLAHHTGSADSTWKQYQGESKAGALEALAALLEQLPGEHPLTGSDASVLQADYARRLAAAYRTGETIPPQYGTFPQERS